MTGGTKRQREASNEPQELCLLPPNSKVMSLPFEVHVAEEGVDGGCGCVG